MYIAIDCRLPGEPFEFEFLKLLISLNGCSVDKTEVFLAHVGELHWDPVDIEMALEKITQANLKNYRDMADS